MNKCNKSIIMSPLNKLLFWIWSMIMFQDNKLSEIFSYHKIFITHNCCKDTQIQKASIHIALSQYEYAFLPPLLVLLYSFSQYLSLWWNLLVCSSSSLLVFSFCHFTLISALKESIYFFSVEFYFWFSTISQAWHLQVASCVCIVELSWHPMGPHYIILNNIKKQSKWS